MIQRIILLREKEKLNQEQFAERIGVSRNFISLVENGKRNLSDRTIQSICREFNVSAFWLQTGKGEMYEKTSDVELAARFGAVLAGDDDFQKRFLSVLMRMEPKDWHFLEDMIKRLSEESKKAAPNQMEAAEEIAPNIPELDENGLTPEEAEELERIRQEMIAKRGRTARPSALPNANAS